jgi:hypothetical protein
VILAQHLDDQNGGDEDDGWKGLVTSVVLVTSDMTDNVESFLLFFGVQMTIV